MFVLTAEGGGRGQEGGVDRRREGQVSERHLLVFHRVQPVLVHVDEGGRLRAVSIQWLVGRTVSEISFDCVIESTFLHIHCTCVYTS